MRTMDDREHGGVSLFEVFIVVAIVAVVVMFLWAITTDATKKHNKPRFEHIQVDQQICVYDNFRDQMVAGTCKDITPG